MKLQSSAASERKFPYETDPSTWPLNYAMQSCISVDFGRLLDYSAIIVVSCWEWQGDLIYALQHIERLPLETPESQVLGRAYEIYQQFSALNSHPQVVLDVRNQSLVFELFCGHGFHPMPVGISFTRAEAHAENPTIRNVKDRRGRNVGARVFSLSRNTAIYDFAALSVRGSIAITETGDIRALREEIHGLQSQRTASANERLVTKSGAHDDLIVAIAAAIWGCRKLKRPRRPPNEKRSSTAPLPARAWC